MPQKTAEARAAYQRAWRERHKDYHRTWRAGRVETERAQRLERNRRYRLAHREEIRARRPSRALPPVPAPWQEDEVRDLYALVRKVVPWNDYLTGYPVEDFYDALGEATLAQLEGRDPLEAARAYARRATGLRFREVGYSQLREERGV